VVLSHTGDQPLDRVVPQSVASPTGVCLSGRAPFAVRFQPVGGTEHAP
jgi:hypothetical protein